jgi:hypothetical protein
MPLLRTIAIDTNVFDQHAYHFTSATYSEEVPAILATFRYGMGMPPFRIEKLHQGFGVSLPVATQWELLGEAAQLSMPILECLIQTAAQAWLSFTVTPCAVLVRQ